MYKTSHNTNCSVFYFPSPHQEKNLKIFPVETHQRETTKKIHPVSVCVLKQLTEV